MKKISISVFGILTICIIIFLIAIYSIIKISYTNQSKEILKKTEQLLQNLENTETEDSTKYKKEEGNKIYSKEEIMLKDDTIGILRIPSLNIEAPIKEGTTQQIMKTAIGHFTESDYWNGNVSLASHNGGTYAHYFKSINRLQKNDEIEYITKLGKKKYQVNKICEISSYDWTEIITNQKEENSITLITCIDGKPNYRLCVKGIEMNV